MRSQLAKGQIAAQDRQARGTERTRQRHEKRRTAVRPRAVGQYKAVPSRTVRAVQEPSNGYFIRWRIRELLIVVHTQRIVQQGFIGQTAEPLPRMPEAMPVSRCLSASRHTRRRSMSELPCLHEMSAS